MPESPRMFGAFEEHRLPNGTVVFYRETDHSYWSGIKADKRNGYGGSGRLTGMSTVSAPFDFRPDALMRYAARLNGEGVAILAAEGLSLDDADDMRSALDWLRSGDSIWRALADASLLYSDLTEQRAKEGTNVHKHALHALAAGKPVPNLLALTDVERGYARGVMAFWHHCEPEPLQAEQVVADVELGVAGRFDLRAHLHGPYGGAVAMVDAKTSGFIPVKHHVQTRGYDMLAGASGFGRSDRCLILQVDAHGGYELIDVHATDENVRDAISVYREAGRINRECRQARARAQEALAA